MYEKSILEGIEKLENIKGKKILLQLPEGLWIYADKIINILYQQGASEVIWYKGKTYGACDLPIEEAKRINANLVIHIAHSPFLKEKTIEGINIEYIEVFADYDINFIIEELVKHKIERTVLVGHLPFVHKFPEIVKKAKNQNIHIQLHSNNFLPYPGQILGCHVANAASSLPHITYIGDGKFHLKGLYVFKKPILALNPFSQESRLISIKEIEKEEKKKIMRFTAITNAQSLGIIISSKLGQYKAFAEPVKKAVEKEFKNKKLTWIIENEINKQDLDYLQVEAFINLACPRIEDDEIKKPLLSWKTYLEVKAHLS
ncbi:MAG: hypothetical protein GXN99_01530 [Candidatus Nanohaloarchaeota archaeon]|nr:hypothetical protein [Candidatus Nanohaloarchaeota archaeon]